MASFWALNFSILKIALGYDSGFPILFFRIVFAVISTFAIFMGRIRFPRNFRTHILLFVSGSLNVTLFMGFWVLGEELETAALSAIIVYTYPIIAMIFSWVFLSEERNYSKVLAAALGFVGVVVIFLQQIQVSSAYGVVFLLLSAISWAFGTVFYKKYLNSESPETINSFQLLYALPVMLIIALIADPAGTLYPGSSVLLLTLYMGIPATSVAYLIFFHLFRRYSVSEISSYFFVVPALSILFSFLILKNTSSIFTYIGFALISAGIFFAYYKGTMGSKV